MPETQGIPIVFLTARAAEPDEVQAHAVGGIGYITKPFDPAELVTDGEGDSPAHAAR